MFNKFMKTLSNMHKGEKGMTGLETAIILIAFVTVAAVFGYAVLSAGLFSSERAKETIYAGITEAKSAMEISGSVIGLGDNVTQSLLSIKFTLRNATTADNPVDLTVCDGTITSKNKCVISLTTKTDYFNRVKWSKVSLGTDNVSDLLEPGGQFEITIDLNDLGYSQTLSENLTANDQFNVQIKPNIGSSLTIQRQLPPAIVAVMDLH
ncbi:MAG: hypothetical protein ACYDHZ_05690 [Dehalococcoidia bacterium]